MLTPKKTQVRPKNPKYFVGDFETWDGLEGKKFRKGALSNGNTIKVFDTCDEFMRYTVRASRTLYFHNLSFDGRFIINWVLDYGQEYSMEMKIIYSHGIIGILLKYENVKGKKVNIKIIDSLRILLMGQARLELLFLGEQVKHFVDWGSDVSEEDILKRVKSDVVGLWNVLEAFFDLMHKKFGVWGLGKLTLPSMAIDIFRTGFMSNPLYNPFIHYEEDGKKSPFYELDQLIRTSYFGGRVELFGFDVDVEKINGLTYFLLDGEKLDEMDANSLFPSQFSKPYPTGQYEINVVQGDRLIPKYEGFFVGEVYERYSYLPVLPTRYEGKVMFGFGKKIGVWAFPEMRYAQELGLITLKQGYFVVSKESGVPFKDFGDGIYEDRMQMQQQKNFVMEYIDKIVLNGFYGKFGQKFETETYDLYKGMVDVFSDEFKDAHVEFKGDYSIVQKKVEVCQVYQMVDKASYTTSYARVEWHKQAIGCKKLMYVDTDSIHGFGMEHIPLGKKLGEWKPEYTEIIQAVYITPKTYWIMWMDTDGMIKTTCKAKGFPKSLFTFSNSGKAKLVPLWEFLHIIRKGFEKPVYMSLKQAVQRRGTILDSHTFSRRVLADGDDKRQTFKDGSSQPYLIDVPPDEMDKLEEMISALRSELM